MLTNGRRIERCAPVQPSRKALHLSGQREQGLLVPRSADRLHAQRQTRRRDVDRQGDGRLAGDILDRRPDVVNQKLLSKHLAEEAILAQQACQPQPVGMSLDDGSSAPLAFHRADRGPAGVR